MHVHELGSKQSNTSKDSEKLHFFTVSIAAPCRRACRQSRSVKGATSLHHIRYTDVASASVPH